MIKKCPVCYLNFPTVCESGAESGAECGANFTLVY